MINTGGRMGQKIKKKPKTASNLTNVYLQRNENTKYQKQRM
jgi:hypothetical protein